MRRQTRCFYLTTKWTRSVARSKLRDLSLFNPDVSNCRVAIDPLTFSVRLTWNCLWSDCNDAHFRFMSKWDRLWWIPSDKTAHRFTALTTSGSVETAMAVAKGQKGKLKCFIELLFLNSATRMSIICRASFITVLQKTYSCIEIRIDEVTLHVYDFFQYYSATNQ